MTKARKPRAITPQQSKFVEQYFKLGMNGKQAAIAAGYSPKIAAHRAHELLNTAPAVMAAVAEMRAEIRERGIYTVERAVADLDEQMALCRELEQCNALVRAQELKMKVSGLMIEKIDMRVQSPDISQTLIEARKRVMPVQETTYSDVTDASDPVQ